MYARSKLPTMLCACSVVAGCAHAPPATEWLAVAPPASRIVRAAEEPLICRTVKPTGSHVQQEVCLTPEDDRQQRDAAQRILRAAATAPWRGR